MTSFFLALWLSFAPAGAATLQQGFACLAAGDVPCAEQVVERLGAAGSSDAAMLRLAAETAFYASRYDEAVSLLERAVARGMDDRYDYLGLFRRTAEGTRGWTEVTRGRFVVAYAPGVDAVLVDDAFDALERSERHLAPLLGGPLPGRTRLEIYPDGRSFVGSSGLTEKDVRTTGVVALAKWSRVLVMSPRALGRGYTWQDTIAHEYVHLAVGHHSGDAAPVWLHEAIAKYLDNRWQDGADRFRLSVRQQALVAAALRDDAFVSFEKMHPSLAKLDSADEAALAYAQLASLMDFAHRRAGEGLLGRVLPRLKAGEAPDAALAAEAGFASFDAMFAAWKEYVRKLDLVERKLAALPTVLDGGSDMDADPVLSGNEDLRRWVRLGDLLRERGRYRAALVEYAKGTPSDEPQSPLLSNRIAATHLAMGDPDAARTVLEEARRDYPEYALTYKTLGQIHLAAGRTREALAAFREAVRFNPFDPSIQQALVTLYAQRGEAEAAARHERYLRILKRGGET